MKRSKAFIAALSMTAMVATTSVSAAPKGKEVHIDTELLAKLIEKEQVRVLEIRDRLEVIIATDRSTLERDERKALRTEWKSLKKEMDAYQYEGRNVIYISTAGLIIILLLLIILL